MKKLSIPILSAIAGATAALSLVLRIICLFFFYDDIGYYKANAPLPIIASILLLLAIVFFIIASIFSIDKKQSIEPTGKLSQYAALLPMGALIFHVMRIFTGAFNDTAVNKYLMAISAILAAIFFFLIFYAGKKTKTVAVYFGIGAILYVFFCWMLVYFDFYVPINSTAKTFFYLSCSSAVLFIFSEICAFYGWFRAKLYYFSLFSAIAVLSVSSVSAIIGYATGILKSLISLEADIFMTALLVFAIARLIDAQKSTVAADAAPEEVKESTADDN